MCCDMQNKTKRMCFVKYLRLAPIVELSKECVDKSKLSGGGTVLEYCHRLSHIDTDCNRL